ncbi:ribose transport system permease protein/putative xylitol transport system permease protein [Rhodovulum imhoffii]|uniref:Ribose transport system permease protein/putative xylitol transport system permease protein n=1 Tax=Rhodovulum imhoffii TaxID=365340 RepID=A0A2T5BPM1_9RHOB|nr:ABC transporter permease [Rhodovulum imhoffii]MBK5933569.1 ribose ABC transporter permease [Rhodovulum imhoffii]PTN01008.1 ribose transport system permease protein/putative xylitol transport system permease protein [Rhodovulum imhoffii]
MGQLIKNVLRRHGLLLAFLVFLAVVAVNAEAFLTPGNILDVLRQVSITGMMALGVTFVVLTGRLDLSVGSLLTLLTVIVVDQHNISGPFPAIVMTLLAGAAIGAFNGLLIGFVGLNALIVTLAMLSFLQGLVLFYSGGSNVNVQNAQDTWFAVFGRGSFLGLPVPVLLFLSGAIVAGLVLAFTTFGRRIYAVGGNETASIFSGINAPWTVFWTYVVSGLTTAIAAVIMGSRVMGAQNTIGQGYELTVLAGVILGGTSLLGGSGSIWRTVIGISMLGFIQNGLLLLGYPYYVQWLVTWAVIIIAVWIDLGAKRGRIFA